MASTPVVIPPVVPTAPASSAPVVQPSAHSTTDVMTNKLQAVMQAHAATVPGGPVVPPLASPVPSTGNPPEVPVTPPTPGADSTATPGVEIPASTEFDLDNVDFDNPPTDTPDTTTTPATPAEEKPLLSDAALAQQLAEAIEKGDVPEQVESIFLKTSRGKQMLNSFKTLRELAKPPADGGIGRVPTLDEIREGDSARSTALVMRDEFRNNPVSFVHNLLRINPETGQNYFGDAQNIKAVIQNIPAVLSSALATASPQERELYGELYSLYSVPVFNNFLNHQYNVAMSMPGSIDANGQPDANLQLKGRFLDALQMIEYTLFKRARPLNIGPNGQVQPQQSNGTSPEIQGLMQRVQQAEAALQQVNQDRFYGVVSTVETQSRNDVMSDIDTLFKTAGLNKAYSTDLLNPLKNELFSQASDLLKMHDPGGFQTYQVQVQQAARGQVDPKVPAQTYRNLFRNVLRQNSGIRERMASLVNSAKETLDARTARIAQSQTRVEPNGSGVAPQHSVLPNGSIQQMPGESKADFNVRKLQAASQGISTRR